MGPYPPIGYVTYVQTLKSYQSIQFKAIMSFLITTTHVSLALLFLYHPPRGSIHSTLQARILVCNAFDVSIVAQHFYFYQQEMYVPKFPIFFWDKKFDVNLYALLLLFVTPNWRCSHQICIWPNAAWVMYYFAGLHWSCVQFFVVRIFDVYMLFVRFYDL